MRARRGGELLRDRRSFEARRRPRPTSWPARRSWILRADPLDHAAKGVQRSRQLISGLDDRRQASSPERFNPNVQALFAALQRVHAELGPGGDLLYLRQQLLHFADGCLELLLPAVQLFLLPVFHQIVALLLQDFPELLGSQPTGGGDGDRLLLAGFFVAG